MADWLLIRLSRETADPVSFLVADSAGRIVSAPQRGVLAQAAALAPGRRVCVLVPGADVVLTEVDVPVKTGARVQQVVPFALEEQLAEDIDQLHFAVGRRAADSARTPVAVVSRALMQEWLAALGGAGIAAEAMYADSNLIPANPGQAVALLEGDGATVRPVGGSPVTMPVDALAEALELVRPAPDAMVASTERTASGLVLYTGAPEWHQRSREVEAVRERFDGIKVQLLTDGPLALFAQQLPAAATGAINLLQGPYAPATALNSGWKAWRLAAALLVALVALHAAGSAAELVALSRTEQRLDGAIAETFLAAMPGEHNTQNARRRMELRLGQLQNGPDSAGLLGALSALAQASASVPGFHVQALSFREGALELRLAAPSAEALDRVGQSLRSSGWQADLTSGNAAGSGYEGRMVIRGAGRSP
jgi:general secretion pathway protein L